MRTTATLRLVLPAVWMGLIIGLSFIEAPLKFQAPGITIPLGLGIGRLVFWALAIAGWIVLLALTAVSVVRPRVPQFDLIALAAMWVTLAVQTFAVRPALSARSDVIIAGGDPGPSSLHYVYIGLEAILLVLLLVWIVRQGQRVTLVGNSSASAPVGASTFI